MVSTTMLVAQHLRYHRVSHEGRDLILLHLQLYVLAQKSFNIDHRRVAHSHNGPGFPSRRARREAFTASGVKEKLQHLLSRMNMTGLLVVW